MDQTFLILGVMIGGLLVGFSVGFLVATRIIALTFVLAIDDLMDGQNKWVLAARKSLRSRQEKIFENIKDDGK